MAFEHGVGPNLPRPCQPNSMAARNEKDRTLEVPPLSPQQPRPTAPIEPKKLEMPKLMGLPASNGGKLWPCWERRCSPVHHLPFFCGMSFDRSKAKTWSTLGTSSAAAAMSAAWDAEVPSPRQKPMCHPPSPSSTPW